MSPLGEDVARAASSDVAVSEVLSLWEVKAALPRCLVWTLHLPKAHSPPIELKLIRSIASKLSPSA